MKTQRARRTRREFQLTHMDNFGPFTMLYFHRVSELKTTEGTEDTEAKMETDEITGAIVIRR